MPETGRVGSLGREMEGFMSARKIEKVLGELSFKAMK